MFDGQSTVVDYEGGLNFSDFSNIIVLIIYAHIVFKSVVCACSCMERRGKIANKTTFRMKKKSNGNNGNNDLIGKTDRLNATHI